jgi:hypothetical protein
MAGTESIHFIVALLSPVFTHITMTKLEALVTTVKKFTDSSDNSIISNVSLIEIIIYYEYLVDSHPAEVNYTNSNQTDSQ